MVQICHLSIHKVIVLGTDCRYQFWFKKRSIVDSFWCLFTFIRYKIK